MAKKGTVKEETQETDDTIGAGKPTVDLSFRKPKLEVQDIPKGIQNKFDKLCAKMESQLGEGFIKDANEEGGTFETRPIPTGLPGVDEASGIDGLPDNCIIELFGPEGSGKSFIAQCAIAQAQRYRDRHCIYVDLEGGLDPHRMDALGIDRSRLKVIDIEISGEKLFDFMFEAIPSETVSLIVVDSVAAIRSESLDDMKMLEVMKQMGVVSRLMSNGLKRLASMVKKYRVPVIFINQLRNKIGAVGYGSPEDTPGGKALKFYAQMRMDVRNYYDPAGKLGKAIMDLDGKIQIGQRSRVKFVKNKFAPPFHEGMFEIYYGKKDLISEIFAKAKKIKLWGSRLDVITYKLPDGEKLTFNSMEEFTKAMIVGGYVIQMAERILEAQFTNEIEETLLGDDFDIEALEEAVKEYSEVKA